MSGRVLVRFGGVLVAALAVFGACGPAPAFAQDTATLIVSGGKVVSGTYAGNAILPRNDRKYPVGAVLTVAATVPAVGQVFRNWSTSQAGLATIGDQYAQQTTLTILPAAANATILLKTVVGPSQGGNIALRVVNGTIANVGASAEIPSGSKVSVVATVPAGYTFDKWEGSNVTVAAPSQQRTDVTVGSAPKSDAIVTAKFKRGVATKDISLMGVKDGDQVLAAGQTIFGTVGSPADVKSLTVALSARTTAVTVDKTTGLFAVRLFAEDMEPGRFLRLSFTLERNSGSSTKSIILSPASVGDQNQSSAVLSASASYPIVAGRLTFGATPSLYSELLAKGYEGWVREQLNPTAIDDSAFDAMGFDALYAGGSFLASTGDQRDVYLTNLLGYAAFSRRQLQQVMTLFWINHFWATPIQSDQSKLFSAYREKAFGKFRDLLQLSAHSATMMSFLTNTTSSGDNPNENYGREVMELHTVGVNGGYGDADVAAVARIFTGWTIAYGRQLQNAEPSYVWAFNPNMHNKKDIFVPFLNRTFPYQAGANGEKRGIDLLNALADHPKTREFICGKLVVALVADSKPQQFVDRCIVAWQLSDGTVSKMLEAILLPEDFRDYANFAKTKAKTSLEYYVAAYRNYAIAPDTSDLRSNFGNLLLALMTESDMDFRNFGVPTGFSEDPEKWINASQIQYKTASVSYAIVARGDQTKLTVSYRDLLKAQNLSTPEAAAAFLLSLAAGDQYRREEFEAVTAMLANLDLSNAGAEAKIRAAVRVVQGLPSVYLQ